MGTGPAWPAARGPPVFRSRTPRADAGRDGLPGRDHPRAAQIPEFIRARHAGAWAAFADRRAAGEAAVGGCDRRGGISAGARRTHRRCRGQAARVIGGEWKRGGGWTKGGEMRYGAQVPEPINERNSAATNAVAKIAIARNTRNGFAEANLRPDFMVFSPNG